jgi:signal transduction histidine kinase
MTRTRQKGEIMAEKFRILYIHDCFPDCELVRDTLTQAPGAFLLTEVGSRHEFEQALAASDYDLVLSNINILGYEGLDVVDAVKKKNSRISYGTLSVHSAEPDAFSEAHMEVLQAMASVLSEGFERMEELKKLEQRNQQMEEEIERRRKSEKLSLSLSQLLGKVEGMIDENSIEEVLINIRRVLTELDIPFYVCGVNKIEVHHNTETIYSHNLKRGGDWWTIKDHQGKENIKAFWSGGVPVYRPDLTKEDPYHERPYIRQKGSDMVVRSILDVPFLKGTLVINSLEPNAFSEWDIHVLQEIASVLNQGYKRVEDLHQLKKRNLELEYQINKRNQAEDLLKFFSRRMIRLQDKRNQAEDLLKFFSRRMIRLQEEERGWVARQLHDGVAQVLTVALLNLHRVKEDPDAPELIQQYLDKASQEIRLLAGFLHPRILDDLGLLPAIRSLAKALETRSALVVETEGNDLPARLEDEIEITLYRIVQEALNNIEKHARASQVKVLIWQESGQIAVEISDDGCGFQPNSGSPQGGMGLHSMEERAALLKGSLTIESAPGRGTKVTAHLPGGLAVTAPVIPGRKAGGHGPR